MRLGHIIKTYADHISYPVNFSENGEERRLNSASALWTRPKSEISQDDYDAFFADMGAGFGTPILTLTCHRRRSEFHEPALCAANASL